jgi:hypothetical protein
MMNVPGAVANYTAHMSSIQTQYFAGDHVICRSGVQFQKSCSILSVELSAALQLHRAMEMTFWLPETEAALAQVKGP